LTSAAEGDSLLQCAAICLHDAHAIEDGARAGTVLGRPHPNRLQMSDRSNCLRLPRIWRFSEARNIRRYDFEDFLSRMSVEEQQAMQIVVAAMKVLLLRTVAPKRVAGSAVCWSANVAEMWRRHSRVSGMELSVDGSSFVAISDRWTELSASRNVMNLCRM